MSEITVGVLVVSDSCSRKIATDESGVNLTGMVENGIIKSGKVLVVGVVPDCKEDIERTLKDWCDKDIDVILTTGGTGLSKRDVTPEATMEVSEKLVPGISHLMLKQSLSVTSFAALSRAVVGVRGNSLIINLPGSKKGSQECLEAVAEVIPHAVHLIKNRTVEVKEAHTFLTTKESSVSQVGKDTKKVKPHCVEVCEVEKILRSKVCLLKKEKVTKYDQARGHVLAEEVVALECLPPFDVSLVDGYAIPDESCDSQFIICGVSKIGDPVAQSKLASGSCVKVSTGAAIPIGTAKVVRVENTLVSGEKVTINVLDSDNNIRLKGSDIEFGEIVLEHGTYVDAAALGILAAVGKTIVRVFEKPVVAVMATGNELVNPTDNLKVGKVRDSNRITLMNLLMEENFNVVDLGIIPDIPNELRNSLELGFRKADVVVTSGSMSKGEEDFMKEIILNDFEAEIYFTEVFMKPGKPTAVGVVTFEGKPKLWFGLPGNPASTFVTTHLFLLPALRLIAGIKKAFPRYIEVPLLQKIKTYSRPEYLRAILTYDTELNKWGATLLEHQRSSSIRGCLNANCLVQIPAFNLGTLKSVKAWLIDRNLNLAVEHV